MEDKRTLTPHQIAAITGGVPMTGDDRLDMIISASLMLRTATQLMAGMLAHNGATYVSKYDDIAEDALKAAESLINQFQEGTNNGQKTSS